MPTMTNYTYITPSTAKKTVLVTGAAGFIGSHTAQHLLRRGDDVIVLDEVNSYYDVSHKLANLQAVKDAAKQSTGGLQIHIGDCCDRNLLKKIFENNTITHVCHLAARAGVRASIEDPFVYVHSNVKATVALMEISKEHKIEHFTYASSSSVYGNSTNIPFTELQTVDSPVSPYAATKKSCEAIAHTYSHLYKLPCSGLRFFTVYGPRGRPDMAPYKFMHRIMNGVTIDQYGDGTTARDYTYIDDIVNGVVRTIDRTPPSFNEVYNLGCGNPVKLSAFINTMQEVCETKAKINVMPMQPGDVVVTYADITKATTMLGYKPYTQIKTGLQRLAAWYKEFHQISASSSSSSVNAMMIPKTPMITRTTPVENVLQCLNTIQEDLKFDSVVSWINASTQSSKFVAIAIDPSTVLGEALLKYTSSLQRHIGVVEITNPGNQTVVLNALLRYGANKNMGSVLFTDVESKPSSEQVATLVSHLTPSTLVVGGELNDVHLYLGDNTTGQLTGLTSPCNRLSLWSIPKLSKTGFLFQSNPSSATEINTAEIAVITLHQKCFPGESDATVLRLEPPTEVNSLNMATTRLQEATSRLKKLGLSSGKVFHDSAILVKRRKKLQRKKSNEAIAKMIDL